MSKWSNGYLNSSGNISVMSNNEKTSPFIEIEENTEYTYSFNYSSTGEKWLANCFYNANKTMIGSRQATGGTKEKTVTAPEGAKYIRISSRYLYNDATATAQLEVGSTATSYIEHQEQNLPFTFAEGQFLAEDGSLQDDGIHNVKYKFAPTSITGIMQQASSGLYYCYVTLPKLSVYNLAKMYSTHFKAISGVAQGRFYMSSATTLIFTLYDQTLTTTQAVNNWLQEQRNNGTPVIFELISAEEEITAYNSTQASQYEAIKNARAYADMTIIESTSDEEGFDMYVEAIGDANKIMQSELQEIKSAVIALGGDLNV